MLTPNTEQGWSMFWACLPALSVEKSARRLLNRVSSLLISGCTSAVFALLTAARDCA